MPAINSLTEQQLQAICDILAETSSGLSGSEIGRLLAQFGIENSPAGNSKRERLYLALSHKQRQDRCANNVLYFIQMAMDPVRYVQQQALFESRREQLNQALSFAGYALGRDGKLVQTSAVKTLSEAEQRAGHLRSELQRRDVHPDVLRFCKAEFLQENYFHAVLEATKSISEKIRQKTGLTADGAELVDQAFGLKNGPKLAINALQTESEQSEHKGLMNLMKGVFGDARNPTAHSPKISWTITEKDALDLLTMISYIHRKLDRAVGTGK